MNLEVFLPLQFLELFQRISVNFSKCLIEFTCEAIGSLTFVCWKFFFFFNWEILFYFILFYYFTILYWFCHTSTCIRHGCTRVPHPKPPSHLLEVFNHSFNFSACDSSVHIFCFLLVQSWETVSKNLSFHPGFPFMILCIPVKSVVSSLFSFLTLLFWVLSLFFPDVSGLRFLNLVLSFQISSF